MRMVQGHIYKKDEVEKRDQRGKNGEFCKDWK